MVIDLWHQGPGPTPRWKIYKCVYTDFFRFFQFEIYDFSRLGGKDWGYFQIFLNLFEYFRIFGNVFEFSEMSLSRVIVCEKNRFENI